MARKIMNEQKKVLMIVPFVSVAMEKLAYFKKLFDRSPVLCAGYFGGTGYSRFEEVDLAICTIEKANSLVNRIVEDESIHNIGMVVVDEIHMIGDEGRGYLLELLVTKLLFLNRSLQVCILLLYIRVLALRTSR